MTNGSLKISDEVYVNLPEVRSDNVIMILPLNEMIFTELGQGCGLLNKYGGKGSGTSYLSSYYDQKVFRESSCHDKKKEAKRELELRIKEADKVLEIKNGSETNGKKTRVILETKGEKKWVDILNFDDDRCISIISAPTLKPALEFEKLQESQN
jgi:hypothetical protein